MPIAITDNEATAARRRVPLLIYASTAGDAWAGSVSTVKAQLSVNGGTEVASTNDIVRVAGVYHYVELTQAEANRTPGDRLSARVAAATGRLEAISYADITADDVFAAAATDGTIATAVDAVLADNFAAIATGTPPSAAAITTAVLGGLAGAEGATARTNIGTSVWASTTRELTTISAAIRELIADSLLGRAIQGGANGARTVTSALRGLRNRVVLGATSGTVFAEDDATPSHTVVVARDASLSGITSIDPS